MVYGRVDEPENANCVANCVRPPNVSRSPTSTRQAQTLPEPYRPMGRPVRRAFPSIAPPRPRPCTRDLALNRGARNRENISIRVTRRRRVQRFAKRKSTSRPSSFLLVNPYFLPLHRSSELAGVGPPWRPCLGAPLGQSWGQWFAGTRHPTRDAAKLFM